jgi:hypothetical protein
LIFGDSNRHKTSGESDDDSSGASSVDHLEQIVTYSALVMNESSMEDKKKLMNVLFKIIFMYHE